MKRALFHELCLLSLLQALTKIENPQPGYMEIQKLLFLVVFEGGGMFFGFPWSLVITWNRKTCIIIVARAKT